MTLEDAVSDDESFPDDLNSSDDDDDAFYDAVEGRMSSFQRSRHFKSLPVAKTR